MLHQVGVSFDLYYDAPKHKIKIISNNSVFALGKVTLGQNFLPELRLYPVSIIPHLAHTHLHFNIILIRRASLKILGTFT